MRWVAWAPAPNAGSSATENRADANTASSGPSQAIGRVQPIRRPSGREAGVEHAERGDDQQHGRRGRGVEERAPRRRDREQEAGGEERQHGDEHDGPQRAVPALPRQRDEAQERDRDAQEQQDVEQVVGEAVERISSRPPAPTPR